MRAKKEACRGTTGQRWDALRHEGPDEIQGVAVTGRLEPDMVRQLATTEITTGQGFLKGSHFVFK